MDLIITTYKEQVRDTQVQRIDLAEDKGAAMNVVNLYPNMEYQTFHGFGGAITEAAGYSFSKLTEKGKEEILKKYFSNEGLRYHFIRTHIDSCDFSISNYTAMEDSGDREMTSFSLKRDEEYILPFLRKARSTKGEDFDLMLTPWSPPAFMKTNEDRNNGGKLKEEYREFWADYICRYIKEYEALGFPVNRITVQNEPDAVQTWDSCTFNPTEEKEFLRDYLYKALERNGLTRVKVNIWDHNKERMFERARAIIDDETDKMIDGVAFHWYTGDHFEAIQLTGEVYPGKELLFTEGCVEYSRFDAGQLRNAQMYAHDIIGNLNAGMTGFIDWNILLDEKGGPNHVNNLCDAPIMVNTEDGSYEEKLSFHYIRHFSHYIDRDAKRIALTKYTDKLEMTALKNPDGTVVLIVLNKQGEDMPLSLRIQGLNTEFIVPAASIVTAVI
ncbi:glycoside hydrolase family 30 beta sandwich domain-containing protein [Anaerocolumna sp. AGMB13020]|uniref:glycoside hydrolase family 30 protein n=1 Tax=Anaerocolumna sp. AGMB13020 TaxID=3081750 RepID=UPI0029540A6D|nr:glycoside hydrolase family 30 beta sandwich domain-containing protein [Anaerocolumna sp. AGMB13020]WOO38381.1 glycoside hydrolase family 30 beta sandwich domain-containing protein [Anaerocolumna sp. AGMB13020]